CHRADQADAGRDRLRGVRIRQADADADGDAPEQERGVREGEPREPVGRARQRAAARGSAGMDSRSFRAGSIPDCHIHLAPPVQEVPRREDPGRAQGRHQVRLGRRTEVQRGARLHRPPGERRDRGLQGARPDHLMGRIAQIRSAASPGPVVAAGRTEPVDSISRPPSAAGVATDRLFRTAPRLGAWAAVALVFYVVWDIAQQAVPAMREYGAGFLVGTTWDANKQQFGILPAIVGTLYTSFLGLAIGSAFGIAIAIFLSEGFLASGL